MSNSFFYLVSGHYEIGEGKVVRNYCILTIQKIEVDDRERVRDSELTQSRLCPNN